PCGRRLLRDRKPDCGPRTGTPSGTDGAGRIHQSRPGKVETMRACAALMLVLASCGGKKATGLFHEQETGLHFTHRSGASGKFYMTEIMGAGVALFDYDNDGDLDIFFVQSAGESRLFRNELVP